MILVHKFYKENGTWYIDLESWQGDKSDLAMVLGADTLLEELANGNDHVHLLFGDEQFDASKQLVKDHELELIDELDRELAMELGGAFYKTENMKSVWLCDVTQFIFGYLPETIWYKKINKNELDN